MSWYSLNLTQVNEAEFEAEMLKKKEREERQMLEAEAYKQRERLQAKQVLKHQMDEKAEKEREAYEQYLKEKEQVEKVMQTLIDSEMR